VTVFSVLAVSTATVLFFPVFLQAMALGYAWCYAYGGLAGVGLGGLVLLVGSWLGASIGYALGSLSPRLVAFFASMPPRSFLGRTMDAYFAQYQHAALIVLLLLRSSPFVPFTPLNYYCGASDRFTFGQFTATFLAFTPLAFMYVGIGGAILHIRLIDRGEADPGQYMPFIWTGFSLAIVFTLSMAAAVYFSYKKVKKGAGGVAASTITLTTTGGPTVRSKSRYSKTSKGEHVPDNAPDVDVEAVGGGAPPPPPPPDDDLPPGWREVASDDGEIYYFNDETGDSRWEKPTARDGSVAAVAPPIVEPQAFITQKSSELGMAE